MSSLAGRIRKECRGDLRLERGDIHVDCSKCNGPRDISKQRCFSGLSGKLTPGFRGNIVLSSHEDEMFSGPPVDALSASSDIVAAISVLHDSLGGLRIDRRIRMKKLIDRISSEYSEDPARLAGSQKVIMKEARRLTGSDDDPLMDNLSAVFDMTDRMIRRLDKRK